MLFMFYKIQRLIVLKILKIFPPMVHFLISHVYCMIHFFSYLLFILPQVILLYVLLDVTWCTYSIL